MWGQNAKEVEEIGDADEASKLHKQLKEAKQYAWKRWKHVYIRSSLESYPVNKKTVPVPDTPEIVLVVWDEKKPEKGKDGRVMYHLQGSDETIMGVSQLHKGHHI